MIKLQTNNISFIRDYFNNVPNSIDDKETKAFKQIYINSLSLSDAKKFKSNKIDFNSDRWNLNVFFNKINDPSYSLNFAAFNIEIKNICKHYIYSRLKTNIKPSSLHAQLCVLKPIIKDLYKITKTYKEWNTILIYKIIEQRNLSVNTKRNTLWACSCLFDFIKFHYSPELDIDCEAFLNDTMKYKKIIQSNPNKIANIPDEYFSEIISTATSIMKNINEDLNSRAIAALIIMLAYTGMRISDLLGVEVSGLQSVYCIEMNKYAYILKYFSRKATKINKVAYMPYTYLMPQAKEAYDVLNDIKKQRHHISNNFLFTLADNRYDLKYPIPKYYFRKKYTEFFYKYLLHSATKKWIGINQIHMNKILLSVPDTRQFRVHIATQLYEQGVDTKIISKWLGHLSESMEGYYVRPKHNPFQRIKFAQKFLIDVVEKDITPLGKNGEEIKNRLKQFIYDNKFNIHHDMDKIITKLGDSFVVRTKTGGICIKTSLIPCSKDERTDKILCSYNYCPNLYQFFYMVDVTYQDFKSSVYAYEFNKKNKHVIEAEKELIKIQNIIKIKLLPELVQLKQQIDKHGENTIKTQYKNLTWIIDNQSFIEKEIKQWTNKKWE